MPNRLENATSPYLLQHADNPVDWHEWGEEAFTAARESDRPILLSVGYAACHWCHVMAHESFEDETTAQYMNQYFVNVKVDREERPDVDRIYMDAVQAMTGRGGWPMTVFLTPAGRPFYAGTYYPKEPHGHHPTFMQILSALNAAWHEQRSDLVEQAAKLTAAVQARLPEVQAGPTAELVPAAIDRLEERFDAVRGGFGGAPKFPQVPTLELLLRVAAIWPHAGVRQRAQRMLTETMDAMAAGGIYDHLFGGFARYSVDAEWLVPHFEKMLYDNALLARLYTQGWQLTGNDEYRRVAKETLDYLARDMLHDSGGIFSAEDADSEGEEGKFAIWSASEFAEVTGNDAALMAAVYGVTPAGNFEGNNVLERYRPLAEIEAQFSMRAEELTARRSRADAKLSARRRMRTPPAVDDKVVVAWNGLAMRAFADAAAAFDEPRYLEIATGIARFVVAHGMTDQGRLVRAWRDGNVSGPGFCDDYAAVAVGLIALYQAGGDERWYRLAIDLIDEMIRLFVDDSDGGFFATGSDTPDLIARPKNLMDNPTPADNSLAAEALVLRHALTGEQHLLEHVSRIVDSAGVLLTRHPAAAGHLLAVLASLPLHQVAVATTADGPAAELVAEYRKRYRPRHVLAVGSADSAVPLLGERTPLDGLPTAYVCEDFVCSLPTTDVARFAELLRIEDPKMPDPQPDRA